MKMQEESNVLKEEYKNSNGKFAQLSEDEREQVTGGRDEHTIPLPGSPEFWESWNPSFSANAAHADTPGFIDSDDYIHERTHE